MTRVKICGIRRVDDALAAVQAGADMLGFVFAPARRQVTPEVARDIIEVVRGRIQTVGVFVNASPGEMNRVADFCGLDYVQLSGDEAPGVVMAVEAPTIKAVHVGSDTTPDQLLERIATVPAAVLLLDTARTGAYGGTGEAFDWRLVPALPRPVLLAGGLRAENVAEAIRVVRPWGVDVSSGVETDGEKDPVRIRDFLAAVKSPVR